MASGADLHRVPLPGNASGVTTQVIEIPSGADEICIEVFNPAAGTQLTTFAVAAQVNVKSGNFYTLFNTTANFVPIGGNFQFPLQGSTGDPTTLATNSGVMFSMKVANFRQIRITASSAVNLYWRI